MNRPPPAEPRLSRDAAGRRDALLETLRPVVERRGRVRRVRRLGAAGAFTLGALAGTWFVVTHEAPTPAPTTPTIAHAPAPAPRMAHLPTHAAAPAPAPAASSRVTISIIKNDPAILARCSVRPSGVLPIATNAELQAALRDAGQDPGLVKIGGTMMLASQIKK